MGKQENSNRWFSGNIIRRTGSVVKNSGIDPFPIRQTLKGYNFSKAKADVRAAMNVALLDFPQGMAYAMIAGFPVQVGIYCSALASLTGPFLASSRFIMLGPTNATAVLLLSAMLSLNLPPDTSPMMVLPLLLILVGVFMIAGAFLRVASLVQYISRSVVTGYITAAAFLIIINQMKHVLGVDVERAPAFAQVCIHTIEAVGQTHLPSLLVAVLTLAVYILVKRYLKALPNVAFTLVVMALVVAGLKHYAGIDEISMINPIDLDSWRFGLPHFEWNIMSQLAQAAFAIAFLSILESSSIAKTLAARSGDRVNINQQMISIGTANMVNAFGGGMAVSGSLTRSMLNFNSGARTPMSSIFSGLILVGGLFTVGRYIDFIPRPSLAALVIAVGVSLINREQIRTMIYSTKADATAFLITLGGGLLFSLDTAIYMGAAASIILFLRKASRPELEEIAFNDQGELSTIDAGGQKKPEISIVHVEGDLFFGAAEIFLDQARLLVQDGNQKIIIFRMRNARHLDATSALAIGDLVAFARSKGSFVLISGVLPEVEKVLRRSRTIDIIGEENLFSYKPENPNISTRDALKRAQEILGDQKADITLYTKAEAKEED